MLALLVEIHREPFAEFVTLIYEGSSEELEPEAAREWFQKRGADMDKLEKALDHAWNFYRADVVIKNPIRVKTRTGLVNL